MTEPEKKQLRDLEVQMTLTKTGLSAADLTTLKAIEKQKTNHIQKAA